MILLSVTGYTPYQHCNNMPFLADFVMSDEVENNGEAPKSAKSMGDDWGSGFGSGRTRLFESHDDFDIYCDRENNINYIFHIPELNCTIDHLEYDPDTCRITVVTNDSQRLDLGAKIQWLVRPYIAKEQDLFIIRTENGVAIDGIEVSLVIKAPEVMKTVN